MSEPEQEDSGGEANLVLLLRGLWDVDNPMAWQDIVWRKFRRKIVYCEDPNAEKGATNVLGIAFPSIFVQFDGFFFHITTIPEPFFEDREAVASQLGELRLRQAVLDHEAHISVGVLNYPDGTDRDEVARMISRMTAAVGWSPATLAVVSPLLQQVRVWDKNVRRALRTEHPVKALTETPPSKVPVVPGDADDADLKAATEEARRRWPEFAAAFARKTPDQTFAVKAPFTEGEFTEHMWIKVLKIEDDYLQGVIDNEPVRVKKYRCGTRVRLRVKALSDWMYTEGDKIAGEFTNKALDKAQAARLEQIRAEREREAEDLDDEDDEDEAPPPPPRRTSRPAPAAAKPKSSSGLLWLLVGGEAAVLLLCGGMALGVTVWLLRPGKSAPPQGPAAPQQPAVKHLRPNGGNSGEHIAREFAEALARGDLHAAYTCTSNASQEGHSEEQFRNDAKASRVLEGRLPFDMDAFGQATPRGGHFNLRNKGAGGRHPPAVVLDVVNDDGWWVDKVEWKGPAPAEAPRPAPAQPNPAPTEPKRLRERGGNSDQHIVSDFARALGNRDFRAAYACTSPDYQQKESLEQFTKAVQDSKILDGPMPLQPEFDRRLGIQETRWNLRHFRVPASTPHAAVLDAKPDSLGWWVTRIEWKGN